MTLQIPKAFIDSTIAREGEKGKLWLSEIPQYLESLRSIWDLKIDGVPLCGYVAVVIPVKRRQSDYVLKISWIDDYTKDEPLALETWAGDGAVKLFKTDAPRGAMLLERLDSDTNLEALEPEMALRTAGELLRRLAVPAPRWARTISIEADRLRAEIESNWLSCGKPFTRSILEKAVSLLVELRKQDDNLLVNHDLHYGNVLRGVREPWLVIDPKVHAGDLEFGVAQLIWQRFTAINSKSDLDRMLAIVVDSAGLDMNKTKDWVYARGVWSWLWGLNAGFTEDPARCKKLVEWLA